MCGRYQISDEKDIEEINKILEEINNKYHGTSECKTGEIFPTNNAPILSLADGKMELCLMGWGFPKWDGKGVIINAKSETAAEKKMFSKPLAEKRCVVPSTGFFEWQKADAGKPKDKYLFTTKNSPMLYMAGLWNVFHDGNGFRECFVILTRTANEYINDLHDRMPVIMEKSEIRDWLKERDFANYLFSGDGAILERLLI